MCECIANVFIISIIASLSVFQAEVFFSVFQLQANILYLNEVVYQCSLQLSLICIRETPQFAL